MTDETTDGAKPFEIHVDRSVVEKAIGDQIKKTIEEGLQYQTKAAINDAMSDAITPKAIAAFVDEAVTRITDEETTTAIVQSLQASVAEAIKVMVEESILSVILRIRGIRISGHLTKDQERDVADLRARLFGTPAAGT